MDAGPGLARKAFRAVVRDDAEELRRLFNTTPLRWDAENMGGQSLMEVALERQILGFTVGFRFGNDCICRASSFRHLFSLGNLGERYAVPSLQNL